MGKTKFTIALFTAVALLLVMALTLQAALGDRTLARNTRGADVKDLQVRLKQLGYTSVGNIDGIYGRKTEGAVRAFQQGHGIRVDGVAGKQTITLLKKLTGASTNAGGKPVGVSSGDLNLLAHAVNGEARGEPFEGQVAVAAVLLNRLKDPRFPKTIAGIIYQPGAFSSVNDGQINLPPTASSVKAARMAAQGWDPSHGALYFFDPAKTSNRFIWSRPQIITIAHHIFTK